MKSCGKADQNLSAIEKVQRASSANVVETPRLNRRFNRAQTLPLLAVC